jgi:signal transduction histidine kinase
MMQANARDTLRWSSTRSRNVQVRWSAAPTADKTVFSDPRALRVVLSCLLENAVSHGAIEGRAMALVEATVEGALLVIAVSDQGPGVDPQDRAWIYEPGYRGRRACGTLPQGRGEGLPLARSIVLALGGILELVDRPRGAMFVARVPLGQRDQ